MPFLVIKTVRPEGVLITGCASPLGAAGCEGCLVGGCLVTGRRFLDVLLRVCPNEGVENTAKSKNAQSATGLSLILMFIVSRKLPEPFPDAVQKYFVESTRYSTEAGVVIRGVN